MKREPQISGFRTLENCPQAGHMPSAASGASGAVFLCSLISFVALGDAAYAQQGDLVHFTFGAEQQKFGQKTDRSRKTRSSRKNYRLRKSPPKNLIGSRIKRPRSLSAKTLHKRVSGRRALATTHRKKGRAASDSWERFFGGNKRETSFSIAAFPDGSTISAGYTRSKGNGNADILLLRLGADGKLIWQKTYGGKARDMATSVAILPDGGFVTASISQSGTKNQGNALIMRHDKKVSLSGVKLLAGKNMIFLTPSK